MSENDFPPEQVVAPPSPDLQRSPTPTGESSPTPPGWQPTLDLSERSIAQKPRWPHPNLGWSLLWCLLFLFVTQVPGSIFAVAAAIALSLLRPDLFPLDKLTDKTALLQSEAMRAGLAVGIFVIELSVVGFSLLIIRLVVGRDWMRQLAVRRPSLPHTLLALASLPVLVLMGNAAYNVLKEVVHLPSLSDYGVGGMEEMLGVASSWPWGFAVLVIGLGPGIGEELWCRGFLGRGLVGNYGAALGVAATSFFFGLIHLDPCQGTMAMVMGLWLHFVYLMSRSLWLPMLLHFLNNSLGVVSSRFPLLKVLDLPAGVIPVFVYGSAVLLLMAVAYALYQSRARLATGTPEQLLLWRPAFEGVEYPPDDSGTRVVHPLPSLAAALSAFTAFLLFVLACAAWVLGL